MIQLFVFDLDGTLVDSLCDLSDAVNELLLQCGVSDGIVTVIDALEISADPYVAGL